MYRHCLISIISCFCLLLSSTGSAEKESFKCVAQLGKGRCWQDFNITISVITSSYPKQVTYIKLDKGKSLTQKEYPCKPRDALEVAAKFDPPIWQEDKGKPFAAKRHWFVPKSIPKKSDSFLVDICFPRDFQSLPIPLGDIRECKCKFPNDKKKK